VLSYQLSPNWKFDYSTALDVTRRQVLSQRFSLTRRLHCWDAVFTRSFTPGGEAEYYLPPRRARAAGDLLRARHPRAELR